jgi:hypothetical protein
VNESSSQLPGQPPPDPWPPGPPLGYGFGQNQPISTLPPVVALTGQEWMPVVQNTPFGTPVTMRATATQVAQTLPANPNAVPAAFAEGQTILSGPAPTFAWMATSFNALPLVSSWNGETGNVVMQAADVVDALGYVPQSATQVAALIAAASSNATPIMDGSASAGTSAQLSRADHVHPSDTSRYSASNPAGFQTAAQVTASLANYLPLSGGTVSGGTAFTAGIILATPVNLQIGGGSPGQMLSTNGSGGLSWQGGAGIPEAPTDGQLYGRENATWVVISDTGGGGIPDAPNDGTLYARENGSWQHITHTDISDWTSALAPYALTASVPTGSSTLPLIDGTAAIGVATTWARADHVHPAVALPPPVSVSATAPSSPVVGQLWWDTVGGQLYIWFNDGTSSQWVIAVNAAISLPPASTTTLGGVKVDGTTIEAASDGTISTTVVPGINDNRIINGDMRIDQRNAGAAGSAVGYTVDRWAYGASQAAKGSWQRNANSPSAPGGFPYGLLFTSASAFTPAASDYFQVYQYIEADMISDFQFGSASAQPVTLSFWAYSGLTGTFSGCLSNYASTRSYPFTYLIPVANTWTRIVVNIPGDTTGTWVLYGNSGGATLHFDLGAGSTYRAAAGAWISAGVIGVTGAVSVVATNSAIWLVTGVKLEIGSVATPYNRQSLAKSQADCERYFRWLPFNMVFQASVTGATHGASMTFSAMRAIPTIGALVPDPNLTQQSANSQSNSFNDITPYSVMSQMQAAGAGQVTVTGYRLSASAEL